MKNNEIQRVQNYFGVQVVEKHEIYLGLPTVSCREKRLQFGFLRDRALKKLLSWNNKLLSAGGKEVLIKSIIQAIPTYAMQCFRIPTSICNDIERACARFWWGNGSGAAKMHWHSWKSLCRPKSQGGMGFRNLVAFNKAMLAKQMWRIIKQPDSLLAKVMEARYVHANPILGIKITSSASFIWRSLCWSRSILSKGVVWKVGDGRSIAAGRDNFIPNLKGSCLNNIGIFVDYASIGPFITRHREWDIDMLKMVFGVFFAYMISEVKIASEGRDVCTWMMGPKQDYTVKAGYLVEMGFYDSHISTSEKPKMDWNAMIWNKKIPPKVKIFLWRLLNNSLAVPMSLRRHHMPVHGRCDMCRKDWGTELHCIFLCDAMKGIWKNSKYWSLMKYSRDANMMDIGVAIWKACSKFDYEIWVTTAYFAWLFVCKKRFQPDKVHMEVEVTHAIQYLKDYESAQRAIQCKNIFGVPVGAKVWKPPARGRFRLDIDAVVDWNQGTFGLGAVVRDWKGKLRAAVAMPISRPDDLLEAKVNAVVAGVQLCLHEGLSPVDLFSDSMLVVSLLADKIKGVDFMKKKVPLLAHAMNAGHVSSISHVYNCANFVARSLARFGAQVDVMYVWNSNFPSWLRGMNDE